MDKKVTVLMTSYNCKPYIQKAIESIIKQTYKNWELIIIDDKSTDGSYEFIKEYIEKNKLQNVKLKQNEVNKGCYSSLNEGLLISNGDYITRLDSDDWYKVNKLEKQVKYLEDNPKKMAVVCYYLREGGHADQGDVTLMYRRNVFKEIGFYDSVRFGGDSEYFWRIIKKYPGGIGKINETLYLAKRRPNSLTTSKITGNLKTRQEYVSKYHLWQDVSKRKNQLFLDYPLVQRPFPVNKIMLP